MNKVLSVMWLGTGIGYITGLLPPNATISAMTAFVFSFYSFSLDIDGKKKA